MPGGSVTKSLYVELHKFKIRQAQVSDGTPFNMILGTPNPGDYWFVERIAIHSDTVNVQAVASFLVGDDPQKGVDWTSLMDTTSCVGSGATDEYPEIFVGPGEQVKWHVTGLVAGETVWTNVQISERTLIAAELPAHIDFERFSVTVERS